MTKPVLALALATGVAGLTIRKIAKLQPAQGQCSGGVALNLLKNQKQLTSLADSAMANGDWTDFSKFVNDNKYICKQPLDYLACVDKYVPEAEQQYADAVLCACDDKSEWEKTEEGRQGAAKCEDLINSKGCPAATGQALLAAHPQLHNLADAALENGNWADYTKAINANPDICPKPLEYLACLKASGNDKAEKYGPMALCACDDKSEWEKSDAGKEGIKKCDALIKAVTH